LTITANSLQCLFYPKSKDEEARRKTGYFNSFYQRKPNEANPSWVGDVIQGSLVLARGLFISTPDSGPGTWELILCEINGKLQEEERRNLITAFGYTTVIIAYLFVAEQFDLEAVQTFFDTSPGLNDN
jgi:hypothetical protein